VAFNKASFAPLYRLRFNFFTPKKHVYRIILLRVFMVEQQRKEEQKAQRVLVGKVVSDKMQKTIVVSVQRTYVHQRLKKVMRTSKNYKVHDEHAQARSGDIVKIYAGRPKSKTKYMYLAEIVQPAERVAQGK
jgi:small subunit ribosomal protein S17